jgi:hypothetical protein
LLLTDSELKQHVLLAKIQLCLFSFDAFHVVFSNFTTEHGGGPSCSQQDPLGNHNDG